MNFQGPRDLSQNDKQYQEVMVYLLHIQNKYPKIFEALLQAPQFEYEVEVGRRKKRWARKYLRVLRNLVAQYERETLPTINELQVHKSHVPALS